MDLLARIEAIIRVGSYSSFRGPQILRCLTISIEFYATTTISRALLKSFCDAAPLSLDVYDSRWKCCSRSLSSHKFNSSQTENRIRYTIINKQNTSQHYKQSIKDDFFHSLQNLHRCHRHVSRGILPSCILLDNSSQALHVPGQNDLSSQGITLFTRSDTWL